MRGGSELLLGFFYLFGEFGQVQSETQPPCHTCWAEYLPMTHLLENAKLELPSRNRMPRGAKDDAVPIRVCLRLTCREMCRKSEGALSLREPDAVWAKLIFAFLTRKHHSLHFSHLLVGFFCNVTTDLPKSKLLFIRFKWMFGQISVWIPKTHSWDTVFKKLDWTALLLFFMCKEIWVCFSVLPFFLDFGPNAKNNCLRSDLRT